MYGSFIKCMLESLHARSGMLALRLDGVLTSSTPIQQLRRMTPERSPTTKTTHETYIQSLGAPRCNDAVPWPRVRPVHSPLARTTILAVHSRASPILSKERKPIQTNHARAE